MGWYFLIWRSSAAGWYRQIRKSSPLKNQIITYKIKIITLKVPNHHKWNPISHLRKGRKRQYYSDISFLQKNQSCPNNGQESNHRKGQKSGYQFGPNWYPPKMCQMSGYHFWQNWYSPKMCQKSGYHFWQNWYPPKMCQKSGYHFCHILISIKSTWISISLIINNNLKGKLLYSWWYLLFFFFVKM